MDVDGAPALVQAEVEEDVPTCKIIRFLLHAGMTLAADTSIEAPPSLLPPRHYCDITGLDVGLSALAFDRKC